VKRTIPMLFLIFALCYCGGGGGGSSSSPAPAPIVNESVSGIWNGTFYSEIGHKTYQIYGVITKNNEAFFIAVNPPDGGRYSGNVSVSGASASASLQSYAPEGFTFPNGSVVGTTNVNGTVIAKRELSGRYSGVGDTGTFILSYDSIYERQSSLSAIKGNWVSGYTEVLEIRMNVAENGIISGRTDAGCTIGGSISLIDSASNPYRVNMVLSSCGSSTTDPPHFSNYNGSYNGFLYQDNTQYIGEKFIISISNPSLAIWGFIGLSG
jgi:hypothetical protein